MDLMTLPEPEIDETDKVVSLIESCLIALGGESRSIWTHQEIDPVVNDLLELWQMFHIPNN